MNPTASPYVIPFDALRMTDVDRVGGKNASLGEMIAQLAASGVRVPGGFATTAAAFREFLARNGLAGRIAKALDALDVNDLMALARTGDEIRRWILDTPLPERLDAEIRAAYDALVAASGRDASFAVRSSATAEDLPDASFAGQQETYLNIHGYDNVLTAVKETFASLYNDRAITYRVHKGFAHADVALSAGIQRMVRSDLGASGVMFTLDTESGFDQVVFITASYGLGETVVQGAVNPDEFYVHKPTLALGKPSIVRRSLGSKLIKMVFTGDHEAGKSTDTVDVPESERYRFALSDADVLELARYAVVIETALRPPDGHRVGARRRGRQALRPPGAARDREVARRRPRDREVPPQTARQGAREGARHWTEDRPRPRARREERQGNGPRAGRRHPGHRHDRSQLGAGHEARRGHRHQPRRAHLPCGDHRPRVGHSRHRRHRQRHLDARRGRSGDRVLRRGRHGIRVPRRARVRDPAGRRRGAAQAPRQDHDERGQPRTGVRVRADSQRGRGVGAAGIRDQQRHRHPPQGHPRHRARARDAARGDHAPGAGLRQPRGLLRRQAGGGRGHHRRRLLSQAGHRAPLGLQVQRVPQAPRRRDVRARGGEPHARLPRGVTLRGGRPSATASRWSAGP